MLSSQHLKTQVELLHFDDFEPLFEMLIIMYFWFCMFTVLVCSKPVFCLWIYVQMLRPRTVSSVVLQRGQSGWSTLCKYDRRNGYLFVMSWAWVLRYALVRYVSDVLNGNSVLVLDCYSFWLSGRHVIPVMCMHSMFCFICASVTCIFYTCGVFVVVECSSLLWMLYALLRSVLVDRN